MKPFAANSAGKTACLTVVRLVKPPRDNAPRREALAVASFVVVMLLGGEVGVAGPPEMGADNATAWYMRDDVRPLMKAVTLYVSFDHDSLVPDMASGSNYRPSIQRPKGWQGVCPEFGEGLFGRALVLGSGVAVFSREQNFPIERRGAIALWVRPQGWKRPNDSNTVFVKTTKSTFYLQRQGPMHDKDGKVLRHEAIQYLVLPGSSRGLNLTGGSDWANGRWYLLVANWTWPNAELSVNGGTFQVQSMAELPNAGEFGEFMVGSAGGEPRGLIDELLVFDRPLREAEVATLYRAGTRTISPNAPE